MKKKLFVDVKYIAKRPNFGYVLKSSPELLSKQIV
jgi:hypothetical protein